MICGDVTIVLHCSIWSNQKCICCELTHSVKIEGLRFCPYKLIHLAMGIPRGKGLRKVCEYMYKSGTQP